MAIGLRFHLGRPPSGPALVEVVELRGGGSVDRSWSVATFDIEEADVLDTIKWARDQIRDQGLYAVRW